VTLNAEWARMAGTDVIAARGQILYDVLPNMRERQAAHQRALSGEAVDLDDVLYDLPGEDRPRHYEVHFRPIWDKDGAIAGTLVAASDVTARHEIDQQKDEFIALASHELKTPVTAIKGYAQSGLRAATKLGDERLERTLRVIDDQSNRLTRLINELLDVSRAQSNTLSLYAEPLDLRQLVHEVVNNLQLTAPAFTLDLQVPPRPTVVNADRQRIEQVLVNLVQNAIKYSGQSERVEISVRTEGSEVITTVRDFGVGIPLDQQEQVFERFFRARNVSSRHYSGLGLGLFIARGIVERQGGRMWLQSVEGSGSTFAFALPLLPTNE
jgi:signal transduction histidine kinase